ncbi:MAG: NAD-dependent epimerase/dehydratase family protein, partial [Candidatus Electrothrix sp. AR1]|nr:NAD-dependent epimerase/dehydratase family protein [Candidatus Electrothrix sp. AR1]
MIIGAGLLANAFEKYRTREDITIFASGVSNSLEKKDKEFCREKKLLVESLNKFSSSRFIYFGTCSIYDSSVAASPYIDHKIKMENIIIDSGIPYVIFRLPQVVGISKNDFTLTYYLFSSILNGYHFKVWKNAIRYLVDIEDVVRYVSYIIDNEKQSDIAINVFTIACNVLDIV